MLFSFQRFFVRHIRREHFINQCRHITPVCSCDGNRLANTQGIEVRHRGIRIQTIGLVDDQPTLLVVAAQVIGNHFIRWIQPGPAINQEQNNIRLINGQQ